MKHVICKGYGVLAVVNILSILLIITTFPAIAARPAIARWLQPSPVIEEEETTGHQAFPLAEVEAPPSTCLPRPGYGPGERILFPPAYEIPDVWTIFYLNQDDEFCFAFPMSEGDWATGHWFRVYDEKTDRLRGIRHVLFDEGVNIIGSYQCDLQGNVTGGISQGFAYADCFDVRVDLDMQKLVGWKGAHLVFSCVDRNGKNLSIENIGNIFTVAQVWGCQTFSYYALWLDQSFYDGWWNIKLGRVAAMDDFGSSPIYSFYVTGALNTTPMAFPTSGYLSAYPGAVWGGRLRFNDKDHNLYAMFGVYQTTSRLYRPQYHGADFGIRPYDGANLIWEVGWTPEFQPHPKPKSKSGNNNASDWHGMPGNYKFGVYYTPWKNIPQFYPNLNTLYAYGLYWLFDQMVYQAVPGTNRGLTLWGAFIYSPQQNTSLLPFQGVLGAMYTGLIPRRSKDQSIFAVIAGTFSKDYSSNLRAQNLGYATYELVLDFSYRMNLSNYFFIQPDLQYVIRPGGTGNIPNALVLGVQLGVNF